MAIELPEIVQRIRFDTRGVDTAQRDIDTAMTRMARSVTTNTESIKNTVSKTTAGVGTSFAGTAASVAASQVAIGRSMTRYGAGIAAMYTTTARQTTGIKGTISGLVGHFGTVFDRVHTQTRAFGTGLGVAVGGAFDAIRDRASTMGSTISGAFGGGFTRIADSARASLGLIVVGIGAVIAAAMTMGLVFGRLGIQTNASLETATLQFETLLKSEDKAKAKVAELFEFAKKTPFEAGPIIQTSKYLQTFGQDALNTSENLTLVGDTAAAVSAPIEEVGFWFARMYTQIKGGQPFGEASMRLMELGIMTGQERQELEGLQQSGAGAEVVFERLRDVFRKYSGAMIKQAQSWKGLTSTISDMIKLTAGDVMKPMFDSLKRVMMAFTDWGTSPAFENIVLFLQGIVADLARIVERYGLKLVEWLKNLPTGPMAELYKHVRDTFTGLGDLKGAAIGVGLALTSMLGGSIPLIGGFLPKLGLIKGGLLGLVLGSEEGRQAIGEIGKALGEVAVAVAPEFGRALKEIAPVIRDVLVTGIKAIAKGASFLADHKDALAEAMVSVTGVYVAMRGISKVQGIAAAVQPIIALGKTGGGAGGIVMAVAAIALAFAYAYTNIEEFRAAVDRMIDITFGNFIRGAKQIAQGIEDIFTGIADLDFTTALDGLADAFLGFAKTLPVLFVTMIGPALALVPMLLIGAVMEFGGQIGDALMSIPLVKAIVDWITTAWNDAFGAVSGVVSDISDWLTQAWDDAFAAVAPIVSDISDWLTGAFDDVKNAVGDVAGWFEDAFNTVSEVVSTAWNDYIKPVIDGMVTIWNEALFPALKWLGGMFSVVWNLISGVVRTVWNIIKPFFDTMVEVFGILLPVALDIVRIAFDVAWAFIKDVVNIAWNLLKPIFDVMVFIFTVAIPTAIGVLIEIFKVAWGIISEVVSYAWNTFLKPIWDTIYSVLSVILPPVIDALGKAFSIAWDIIKVAISTAWDIIKPIWDSINEYLVGPLLTGWEAISKAVGESFGKIPEIIKGALRIAGNVISWFLNIAGDVVGAIGFDNVASALHDAADKADRWGETTGGGEPPTRNPSYAAPGTPRYRASGGAVEANSGPWKTNGVAAIVGEGRRAYPEYVIPTDPQYRKRAIGFMLAAAKDIGFAAGGDVWHGPGPDSAYAQQQAYEEVKRKLDSGGGGGFGDFLSGTASWISDAWGTVTGFLRDMAADGLAALWPKAADIPGLRDLRGLLALPADFNDLVREKVLDIVRGGAQGAQQARAEAQQKQEAAAASAAGAADMGGLSPGARHIADVMAGLFGVHVSSGYRPGDPAKSWHHTGHAVDLVPIKEAVFRHALANTAEFSLAEAIWKNEIWHPGGMQRYPYNDHYDHVHLASYMDRGGVLLPGANLAFNATGRPERLVPAGAREAPITINTEMHINGNVYGVDDFEEKFARLADDRDEKLAVALRQGR